MALKSPTWSLLKAIQQKRCKVSNTCPRLPVSPRARVWDSPGQLKRSWRTITSAARSKMLTRSRPDTVSAHRSISAADNDRIGTRLRSSYRPPNLLKWTLITQTTLSHLCLACSRSSPNLCAPTVSIQLTGILGSLLRLESRQISSIVLSKMSQNPRLHGQI